MTATLKLVSIGNSKGVRIPAEIIRRYNLHDQVEMKEVADGILLRTVSNQKLSFAASFAAMAKDHEHMKEIHDWTESFVEEGLEG